MFDYRLAMKLEIIIIFLYHGNFREQCVKTLKKIEFWKKINSNIRHNLFWKKKFTIK
jgi:hypothetical protein